MRVGAIAIVGLLACSSGGESADSSRERSCEQLRDHVVDLRLVGVENDLAQHRAAIRGALGNDFVASCATKMSDDEIACALTATEMTAAAACARQGTTK